MTNPKCTSPTIGISIPGAEKRELVMVGAFEKEITKPSPSRVVQPTYTYAIYPTDIIILPTSNTKHEPDCHCWKGLKKQAAFCIADWPGERVWRNKCRNLKELKVRTKVNLKLQRSLVRKSHKASRIIGCVQKICNQLWWEIRRGTEDWTDKVRSKGKKTFWVEEFEMQFGRCLEDLCKGILPKTTSTT